MDLLAKQIADLQLSAGHTIESGDEKCMKAENLSQLAHLIHRGYQPGANACAQFAANGDLGMLIAGIRYGSGWDQRVIKNATDGGHLLLAEYAAERLAMGAAEQTEMGAIC